MRRELAVVVAIVVLAFGVRVYPAWATVFGGDSVNFLETDAWYHIRLVENQVRNYPWRVTLDPYAAPGGQFVAIAPLFDTITATAVVVLHGRDAETEDVERIGAFIPPVLGALTVFLMWALGRALFDWQAAVLAAALLATLPGHFMDRTMLGFVDHHALEALLAIATLFAIVRAIAAPSLTSCLLAGVTMGMYLIGWSSGAFLLAIVGGWFVLLILLAREAVSLTNASRVIGIAAIVAFVFIVAFQDPRMHRYVSQILGIVGLGAIALATLLLTRRQLRPRKAIIVASTVLVVSIASVTAAFIAPGLFQQIWVDIGRLAPDPSRMGVLEARPLFLYPGEWNWQQPWEFFRTGFYVGLIALVLFTVRVWRVRNPADLLVWIYAVSTFVATIGQNRFGYYLVTACALLGGWLAARILHWGEMVHKGEVRPALRVPFARELAAMVVAATMFAPNVARSVLLAPRSGSLAGYWHDAMMWLRQHTPPPFQTSAGATDDYYFARYPHGQVPLPDYAIMNWWDQGYWLSQRARRVPVANPTQERAPNAARFYAETDEMRAVAIARQERARFVLSDWELPFRLTADRSVMGRFQSVLDWASATHANYYEVYYRRDEDAWIPLWVFHAPYYQSMAYRLTVIGGAAATPAKATSVLTFADRTDTGGDPFREVLTQNTYATYDAALQAAAATHSAQTVIVGLDPWQPAFPMQRLSAFVEVHAVRTPEQKDTEAPWVRIFELRTDTAAAPPR